MSYGTNGDADTYLAARGYASWAALSEANKTIYRLRGSEYVDARFWRRFAGEKTGGRAQEREWPRTNAYDIHGEAFTDAEIPTAVEHGAYEAAYRESVAVGALTPDVTMAAQVKKETVVGAVSVEYLGAAQFEDTQPIIPTVAMALRPVLVLGNSDSNLSGSVTRV